MCSVFDCKEDEQEEEHFILSVDEIDPFPIEEIVGLSCTISGFPALSHVFDQTEWGKSSFLYSEDDNSAECWVQFDPVIRSITTV